MKDRLIYQLHIYLWFLHVNELSLSELPQVYVDFQQSCATAWSHICVNKTFCFSDVAFLMVSRHLSPFSIV